MKRPSKRSNASSSLKDSASSNGAARLGSKGRYASDQEVSELNESTSGEAKAAPEPSLGSFGFVKTVSGSLGDKVYVENGVVKLWREK